MQKLTPLMYLPSYRYTNNRSFKKYLKREFDPLIFQIILLILFKVLINFQVSKPEARGWFIPPVTGGDSPFPVWAMFAGILPAFLLYVLLFMETSICQLIMLDKTKGKKGVGVHLDIVLLSGLNCMIGNLKTVSKNNFLLYYSILFCVVLNTNNII